MKESKGSTNVSGSESLRLGSSSYHPSCTTSGKFHPIVQLIRNQSTEEEDEYGKNRIMLCEDEETRIKRLQVLKKQSLDGIGEEVEELFMSNILEVDDNDEDLMEVEMELGNLLN